ncbi:hypothetical protein H1R20_g6480, partial [Candolleomyces eurysporus]
MQPTSTTPSSSGPSKEPGIVQPPYPPQPHNAETAPFSVLACLLENLADEKKHERRRKLINTWFVHWRQEKGDDLYPVLRLLLPQKDRERPVYGLKEKNLAKIFIKLIGLGMRDPDAVRLLNWKEPTEKDKASGDFPQVLYEVVKKRSSITEGTLTIDDVNEVLNDLAKTIRKQDAQFKILHRVYDNCSPEEQRWIIRIILKDMNISVKEATVFSVFHPDAQDLFNICSDLKRVAWELSIPFSRLAEENKAVQLFQAFAPMLCKRPTRKIEDTVKEMGGSEFIIEEKLDGERMQLHKRGNEYFYCSRKGKDYTYLYGKDGENGCLTPFIDAAFDPRITDIILDGEMLVWDPVSQRHLPFGTLKTAARNNSTNENAPRVCFKIFDLLYLNGQSLLNKSLTCRKMNAKHYIKEIPGRFEHVTEYRGKTAKDVRVKMDQVMRARGEGLVIKHPRSKYTLNGRISDWIKVKPEYMVGRAFSSGRWPSVIVSVVSHFNGVQSIRLGGSYGSGKRSGGVSTLICAVMEDRPANDGEPKYRTFARIGTGLSFADFVWVRNKPWKQWSYKKPPKWLLTSKRGLDDKGDLYLEPEDSFMLKVKAAEIVPSTQYHMGFTLRFPRAMAIRDDLSIEDCMTANDVFESMRDEKKRKMEDHYDVESKKQKKKNMISKKPVMLSEYTGPNLSKVPVTGRIFRGITFVVSSDPKSKTGLQDKHDLMKQIHANGGTCRQIPVRKQPHMFVVYGGAITPYDLKLIIDMGVHDVIKPAWITDSLKAGRKMPLEKKYFFHATEFRKLSPVYKGFLDEGELVSMTEDGGRVSEDEDMDVDSVTEDEEEEPQPQATAAPREAVGEPKDAKALADPNSSEDSDSAENDSDDVDVASDFEEEPDFNDWFAKVEHITPTRKIESVNIGDSLADDEDSVTEDEDDELQPSTVPASRGVVSGLKGAKVSTDPIVCSEDEESVTEDEDAEPQPQAPVPKVVSSLIGAISDRNSSAQDNVVEDEDSVTEDEDKDPQPARPVPTPQVAHDQDVKMGETDDAMSYDPDLIFRHLCFYLDSPSNARKHGMSIQTRYAKEMEQSFTKVAKLITRNGGKVVGLCEPKLTHVIIDKRDISRRRELMKLTSKPKRRQLVISDWVHCCVGEEMLLDEDGVYILEP